MGENDYYAPGDWNVACSMCGRKMKASQMVKNWQGMYRCVKCNEPRHPQDFVRAVQDVQTVPFSQHQLEDDIPLCTYNGQSAWPGYAIPGCSMPGRTQLNDMSF
jgi:hypothetical protein